MAVHGSVSAYGASASCCRLTCLEHDVLVPAGGSSAPPWVSTPVLAGARQRWRAFLQPILRASAAAVTLGTGASLGPEGPSVEIGVAAAKGLGGLLRSKQRHYLSLIAAGSGAGQPPVQGRLLGVANCGCMVVDPIPSCGGRDVPFMPWCYISTLITRAMPLTT